MSELLDMVQERTGICAPTTRGERAASLPGWGWLNSMETDRFGSLSG